MLDLVPAPLFALTPKLARRVREFFLARIENDYAQGHTNATGRY